MDQPKSPHNFLPDFCTLTLALVMAVSAELLAMVLSLASGEIGGFWERLGQYSLFVQWIALSTAALLCLLGRFFRKLDHFQAGLGAWILILLVGALVSIVSATLTGRPVLPLLVSTLGISGIISALILRYLYEHFRQRQQALAESQAKVAALQARIRPHFLFNSMNTIAQLTRNNPLLAEEIIGDLADLFRASLGRDGAVATLDEELDLARAYLRIEQQRLGDRLQVEWQLDALPGNCLLPPLTLQPLLENAVYHGIEPSVNGGTIRIHGKCEGPQIHLFIGNTLAMTEGGSRREGSRMALDNVTRRLEALFGEEGRIDCREVAGEYHVKIHFPIRRRS